MIPAEKSHLQFSASSHPGMSGKNNEDRYSVTAFRLEDPAATPSVLAIVSDGIGGHRAGEIAAEFAIETINRHIAESNASQPLQTLHQAIQLANQKIHAEAESDPQKKVWAQPALAAGLSAPISTLPTWEILAFIYCATLSCSKLVQTIPGFNLHSHPA